MGVWSWVMDDGDRVSGSDPVVSKALTELSYAPIATRGQKRVQAHFPRGPAFPRRARALCRQERWGLLSKGG